MRYAATTSLILLACLGALLTGGASACAAEPFWAFQPRDDPLLPAVRDRDWAANPLDPFVLIRLQEKQLRPATAARAGQTHRPAARLAPLRRALGTPLAGRGNDSFGCLRFVRSSRLTELITEEQGFELF